MGQAEQRLHDAAERLYGSLRLARGIDDDAANDLKLALNEIAQEWAHASTVPKSAVNLLVDLAPAIESSSYAYAGEEAKRIRDLALEIADLVRESVS